MPLVSALRFGVYVEHFVIPIILTVQAAFQLLNFGINLFTLMFAFFAFVIWIVALRTPVVAWWTGKKVRSSVELDVQRERLSLNKFYSAGLERFVDRSSIILFIFIFLVLPGLATFSGDLSAVTQKTFNVFEKNGKWLLLRRIGDSALFVGYDENLNVLSDKILVMNIPTTEVTTLTITTFKIAPIFRK